MLIYLLRHGDAEQGFGTPDGQRALTEEGKRKVRRVLARAAAAGAAPSVILASPLLRAMETARIAAQCLNAGAGIVQTEALVDGQPEDVWKEIRLHQDAEQMLLAGHEPLLGRMVGWLCGAPGLPAEMDKAALACVKVSRLGAQPDGVLKWLLDPELA